MKKLSKDTYETVSCCININHAINNLTSNVYKCQRQNYKNEFNNESNKAKIQLPPITINNDSYNQIRTQLNQYWVKEINNSRYFVDNNDEYLSRWMDRMMKDKTSFWFDQISYDKIRNDYKRVEKDYNFYVQEKSITSVRKTKSQSPRKHLNVNTARKESDESPVQDLAKTMKSKPKALKTFAIEAELVMATSRATEGVSPNTAKLVRPRKNTINEPKTSEINLMSSKAIKDFINYDNYFGETEEEKSGALDIKLRINPTNSEFELDLKSESGLEKDDESSITGSTNYFGNNQDQNRNEIKVVDSLTINTFTKLSNFSDPLGRKLAFTVDWNYINRYANSQSNYIESGRSITSIQWI